MSAPATGGPRRLRIVHRTGFHYDGMVTQSYNEAWMTPITTQHQTVLAARVSVEPVTWTYSYRDYWDTQVTAFDVVGPHQRLEVGQSHAWIEWWAGEWAGFDPTSQRGTGADHVVVARGRDYTDVTPLKRICSGGHGSSLFVSVEVTRLT